jgi:hypothetical protein
MVRIDEARTKLPESRTSRCEEKSKRADLILVASLLHAN